MKTGAWIASEGLKLKKMDASWEDGFSPKPSSDCCLFFKGESENLVMCMTSVDGLTLETASDVCKKKLKGFHGDIMNSLRGIRFAEAYHELVHNKVKRENCKANEYKLMKFRAEKTMEYAVNVDCKFMMSYSTDPKPSIYKLCYENYKDELSLELKLMSLDNQEIWDSISSCVYKDPLFLPKLQPPEFDKLMITAKLYTPGIKKSSFLEISTLARDDANDDDDFGIESPVVGSPVVKKSEINKEIINFTEVTSKSQAS